MVVLSKARNKRAYVLKICQEEGCGKEYVGHPISKYCEIHKDPSNRKRKRHIKTDVTKDNQIFKHDFRNSTTVIFSCALEKCSKQFEVTIMPKLKIYPKYCEKHRSQYQRERKHAS